MGRVNYSDILFEQFIIIIIYNIYTVAKNFALSTLTMSFLSGFDVFPKYKENVKVKTMFGAGVSIAAIIIMVLLFMAELWDFLSVRVEDHLVIDNTDYELLPINFNFTFNRIPCSSLESFISSYNPWKITTSFITL